MFFLLSPFRVQKELSRPHPHCMLLLVHTCQSQVGVMQTPTWQHGFGEKLALDATELKEESFCQINTQCSKNQWKCALEKGTVHIVSTVPASTHRLWLCTQLMALQYHQREAAHNKAVYLHGAKPPSPLITG